MGEGFYAFLGFDNILKDTEDGGHRPQVGYFENWREKPATTRISQSAVSLIVASTEGSGSKISFNH